jgi:hypothetical protein
MVQFRWLTAEFVKSDVFHEFVVNGIAPDGTVVWSAAGIVCALREAAGEFAVDGWASIAEASMWIAERHPEHYPRSMDAAIGGKSCMNESRVFELQYFEMDGQRSAWYREKKSSANTC